MTPSSKPNTGAYFLLLLAALIQLGATPFEVRVVAVNAANIEVFYADGQGDAAPELFVLSGTKLIMLNPPHLDAMTNVTIDLKQGTSALDIAKDPEDGGAPHLYTVTGNSIHRYALENGSQPDLLFTQQTLLSESDFGPRPYVLVTRRENRSVLSLPLEDGLGVFDFDGKLLHLTPTDSSDSSLQTFRVSAIQPPQATALTGLELRFDSTIDPPPNMFSNLDKLPKPLLARRGTYMQAGEATELPPKDWPWFALAPDKDSDRRVLYALTDSNRNETIIVLRRKETRDLPGEKKPFYLSPKRRYPGRLVIPPEDAPDFNGDGYADLLLWNSPRPGNSIDALMRAAQGGTWPVNLTVHLYSRIHGVYEGRPTTRIQLNVPIAWSVLPRNGLPFQHLVLRDLNGDGKTDISLSTHPRRFASWLFRPPNKFLNEPDYTANFPEYIQTVKLVRNTDGPRAEGTIIALQGKAAMYILSLPRP